MTGDPADDQQEAAIAATERIVRRLVGGDAVAPHSSPLPPKVSEFVEVRAADPCCEHLAARPVQPAIAMAWYRAWYCQECMSGFVLAVNIGLVPLDPKEERTCDSCRGYIPTSSAMHTALLTVGNFLVYFALCDRCIASPEWSEALRNE